MKAKRLWLFITVIVAIGVTVLSMSGCASQTTQEQYPTRDITVVCGFVAGGGSDIWTRVTAAELGKVLPVSVVVTNEPGAACLTALQRTVGSSPPNGYRISLVNSATAMSKALGMEGPDPKNPSQVALLGSMRYAGYFLAGRADAGCDNLRDFVNMAKASPTPIKVGCAAVGGTTCLTNWIFKDLLKAQGTPLEVVALGDDATLFKEMLAGNIKFGVADFAPFEVYLKEGVDPKLRMKLLAVCSTDRHPLAKDVPTFREMGYDVVVGTAHGLAVRPDTPKHIIDYLTKVYKDVANSASYTQAMEKVGRNGQVYLSPDETVKEYAYYSTLAIKLADAGILQYEKK